MSRLVNPGDPTAEANHLRAHPKYNGGDDCGVCKNWKLMLKHEAYWRYALEDWGNDQDDDDDVVGEAEPDTRGDWEILAERS